MLTQQEGSNNNHFENDNLSCLNCDQQLATDAIFCHNCGQATKESKLSVWHIVSEAFTNFFNLDGRFFNTLKKLHKPSTLTQAYVEGKRRKYMNPAKLFIFSLIALISTVMLDIDLGQANVFGINFEEDIHLGKQKQKWNAITQHIKDPSNEKLLTSLSDSLYGNIDLDSMYLGESNNATILGFRILDYKIKKIDAYNLSSDELLNKYEIKEISHRLFIKQYLKMLTNPSGGINYIIRNFSWVILLLVFVMAMLLKLFYIRKNYYYIEHLVLLMYSHSLVFIISTIFFLSKYFFNLGFENSIIASSISIGLLVLQYLSLRKYYKQGIFLTLLKMFMINVAYLVTAIIIITFGAIISFIIF